MSINFLMRKSWLHCWTFWNSGPDLAKAVLIHMYTWHRDYISLSQVYSFDNNQLQTNLLNIADIFIIFHISYYKKWSYLVKQEDECSNSGYKNI